MNRYIRINIDYLSPEQYKTICKTMNYKMKLDNTYIKVLYDEKSKDFIADYKAKIKEIKQLCKGYNKLKEIKNYE